ncbi:MAG: TauD/TfdA family dioxygenase [Alphaproteobacteria bacterium]|nr:TauD/TfdA family dioxygenase [Alphaproteobacteria bacterium]
MCGHTALPHVICHEIAGASADELRVWLLGHGALVEGTLGAGGAILIRGADIGSPDAFRTVCTALTPELRSYAGGGSPRTHVGGGIYTSTEYAARASIPLHIEASYLPRMPSRVWFYCETPPEEGGETPLGDMSLIAARLDPVHLERWRSAGVLYVTNLHGGQGFGRSWMDTYETSDRAVVEHHLAAHGASFRWKADGGLRVELRAPATRRHPRTGQEVWVNQAINWHPYHLGAQSFAALEQAFGDIGNFPKSAFFGDGTPISREQFAEIAQALDTVETTFEWQADDILLVDNERVAHGRRPYRGARSIYVALS